LARRDMSASAATFAEARVAMEAEIRSLKMSLTAANDENARNTAHATAVALGRVAVAEERARSAEAEASTARERSDADRYHAEECRAAADAATERALAAEGALAERDKRASAAENAANAARARATASEAEAESAESARARAEDRARSAEAALADVLLRSASEVPRSDSTLRDKIMHHITDVRNAVGNLSTLLVMDDDGKGRLGRGQDLGLSKMAAFPAQGVPPPPPSASAPPYATAAAKAPGPSQQHTVPLFPPLSRVQNASALGPSPQVSRSVALSRSQSTEFSARNSSIISTQAFVLAPAPTGGRLINVGQPDDDFDDAFLPSLERPRL
jgi:hypothetical protein